MSVIQSKDLIVNKLNEEYEHYLMDFVELWADQRDMTTAQRIHSAKVVDLTSTALIIECIYHIWEDEEKIDVYFQHKASTTRQVQVPLPFNVQSEVQLWAALDQMIQQAQARKPPFFE